MPVETELLKLEQPALISLYELDLNAIGVNQIYRFVGETLPDGSLVRYKGNVYDAIPIIVDGFELSVKAPFPRPTLQISNVFGTISSLILLYQDLAGAKLTRRRTLVKYLDNGAEPGGDELTPEVYFVERKTAENELYCAFQLVSGVEMTGLQLPARKITRRCQWIYRSPDCGYTGQLYFNQYDVQVGDVTQDRCGKRITSCKCRFGANNELPFGGFPSADVPGAF